jgi:hypothetical protein
MEPNLNILLQDLMKQVREEIVKQSKEEIVANFMVHSDPSTSEWRTWRWRTRSVTGCVTGIERVGGDGLRQVVRCLETGGG